MNQRRRRKILRLYKKNQKQMKTRTNKPDPVSHTIQHKSRAANQAPLSRILQAYKDQSARNTTVQREVMEDEDELLQGKFETVQREALPDEEDEEPLQQKTENKTGLPDNLKAGVEAASGFSMDDVRVHYNSSKPAQLQALAYTQGTEIHVGPGQEKHLGHEAWHVVQQKQGRVKPTVQMQGVQVNDDEGLEREADQKANILLRKKSSQIENELLNNIIIQEKGIIQKATDIDGYIYWYGRDFVRNHLTKLEKDPLKDEVTRRSRRNRHIETLINTKSLEDSLINGYFNIISLTDEKIKINVDVEAGTCSQGYYEDISSVIIEGYCGDEEASYNYLLTHLSTGQ